MTAKVVCGSYQHEGYPTEDDKLCTECGGTGYVQPIRETDAGTFTYSGARGQVNYLSEEAVSYTHLTLPTNREV